MIRAAAMALCALVCVAGVSPVFGAGAIFPAPLHITREIQDPISGKTVVLNEYGYGNRLVSVRGDVTAIADYEKGELTEIDRAAGTYSVTRFETIAKLQGNAVAGGETAAVAQKAQPELKAVGAKATKSGHTADFFRAESEAYNVEIALDQSVRVSKEALEVLLGTAYPGTRSEQHDLVIRAATNAARGGGERRVASNSAQAQPQAAEYALPLEQLFAVTVGEERVEFRSSVLRVGTEPPPAEAVAIPAGARLVVSRSAAVLRELEALDAPPLRPPTKP
jgi:hypothetical protein